jgi:orotate phosphoribosyltransferase
MSNLFEKEVAALLPWRKGHFRFESGHHGDTWLNLELLCLQPEPVEQLAAVLADCLSEQRPDVVCGPLVEGAFVALMVARRLRVPIHLHRAHRPVRRSAQREGGYEGG